MVENELRKNSIETLSSETVNLESALTLAGDHGLYQNVLFVTFCFVSLTLGVNFITTPFLFYLPTFYCYTDDSMTWSLRKPCRQIEACAQAKKFGFEPMIHSDKISLITEFNIYCDNAYKEKWAKAFLYVWVGIIVLVFTFLSDKFGRRTCLRAMAIYMLFASAFVIWGTSFETVWFSFSSCYAAGSTYFAISSVYFNEVMGRKLRGMSGGFSSCFFAIGSVLALTAYIYIEKVRNIYYFMIFASAIWFVIFMSIVESPYFLYSKGLIRHAEDSLLRIAAINKPSEKESIKLQLKELFSKTSLKAPNNKAGYSLFQSREINFKVLMCCILFLNIFVGYYLATLAMQQLTSGSIYVNGYLLEMTEALSYFTIILIGNKTRRRMLNIYTAGGILCLSSLLLVIELLPGIKALHFIDLTEAFLSIAIRFLLGMNLALLYNYAVELMPTHARGYCLGCCSLFNKFGGICASFFEAWSKKLEIHPMIFSGTFSFFALIAAIILPETLNKRLEQ